MGKSATVAGMLGAKGVRLEGCGQSELDKAMNKDEDLGLQEPSPKKMKDYIYDRYEEIVSELGTFFASDNPATGVAADKESGIMEAKESTLLSSAMMISPEDKENIANCVKQMSRKELEELILTKIVEVLVNQSEGGKVRDQVAVLKRQKDKLQDQISILHKQILNMGKAIKLLCDNAEDAIKHNKLPKPVILYRTVGLQVNTSASSVIKRPIPAASKPYPEPVKKLNGLVQPPPTPVAKTVQSGPANGGNPAAQRFKPKSVIQRPSQSKPVLPQQQPQQTVPSSSTFKRPLPVGAAKTPSKFLKLASNNSSTTARGTPEGLNGVVKKPVAQPAAANIIKATKTVAILAPSVPGSQGIPKTIPLPPLPPPPPPPALNNLNNETALPPRPTLVVSQGDNGQSIILTLSAPEPLAPNHSKPETYEIYSFVPHGENKVWSKVGDTKALELPMACTLSKFCPGKFYIFIVRGIDSLGQAGPFCAPRPVFLRKTY